MKKQMNQAMTVCLSQQEIDRIYYRQQRIYWEADFAISITKHCLMTRLFWIQFMKCTRKKRTAISLTMTSWMP